MNSDIDDCDEIRDYIFDVLEELDFKPRINNSKLEIQKSFGVKRKIDISFRCEDANRFHVLGLYLPLPQGKNSENIDYWIKRVIARADFCIEVLDDGTEYILVNKELLLHPLRAPGADAYNRPLIPRVILDVCLEFYNRKEDLECADELGLFFQDAT